MSKFKNKIILLFSLGTLIFIGLTYFVYNQTTTETELATIKSLEHTQGTPANFVDLDNPVFESTCPKPNKWTMEISESSLNNFINSKPDYKFGKYQLRGGHIELHKNSLDGTLDIGGGKEVYLNLVVTDQVENGGRDLQVSEIRSVGSTQISGAELLAIKTLINSGDKLIWNYVPKEYKRMFYQLTIWDNSRITVEMYTSEYLECINR